MTKRDSTRHKFDYYEGKVEALEVFSWCPTPEPTVPPTQVHLHFPIAGAKVVFRFKGPGTLDALIAALIEHRRDVFGAVPAEKNPIAEAAKDYRRLHRKLLASGGDLGIAMEAAAAGERVTALVDAAIAAEGGSP